jgi:hypothetical protein
MHMVADNCETVWTIVVVVGPSNPVSFGDSLFDVLSRQTEF